MWFAGKHPPYIDRGKPGPRFQQGGRLVLMEAKVPDVDVRRLKLEELRRHNSLEPELLPTLRTLLRWSERAGTGEFNPEADFRETHYDPLPPDLQEKVTVIVDSSPWAAFIRKLVMTSLAKGSLAEQLGMSRTKFCSDRRCAFWYCRGRFEAEHIYG
jgi:hypothetical protein